jgi:hypothetical protein
MARFARLSSPESGRPFVSRRASRLTPGDLLYARRVIGRSPSDRRRDPDPRLPVTRAQVAPRRSRSGRGRARDPVRAHDDLVAIVAVCAPGYCGQTRLRRARARGRRRTRPDRGASGGTRGRSTTPWPRGGAHDGLEGDLFDGPARHGERRAVAAVGHERVRVGGKVLRARRPRGGRSVGGRPGTSPTTGTIHRGRRSSSSGT